MNNFYAYLKFETLNIKCLLHEWTSTKMSCGLLWSCLVTRFHVAKAFTPKTLTKPSTYLLLVLLETCDWILFFFLFFSLSKSFSLSCSSSMNFQRTNAILLVTHTYIHSFIHSSVRFEIKKKKIFFFFVLFCFFFHNSVFVVYRHKQQ